MNKDPTFEKSLMRSDRGNVLESNRGEGPDVAAEGGAFHAHIRRSLEDER